MLTQYSNDFSLLQWSLHESSQLFQNAWWENRKRKQLKPLKINNSSIIISNRAKSIHWVFIFSQTKVPPNGKRRGRRSKRQFFDSPSIIFCGRPLDRDSKNWRSVVWVWLCPSAFGGTLQLRIYRHRNPNLDFGSPAFASTYTCSEQIFSIHTPPYL